MHKSISGTLGNQMELSYQTNKENVKKSFKFYESIAKLLANAPLLSEKGKDPKVSQFNTRYEWSGSMINQEDLDDLFSMSQDQDLSETEYIKRYRRHGDFYHSVYFLAAYLFTEIILSSRTGKWEKKMTFKLFAVCMNIAQKLLMDDAWIPQEFAMVSGFKMKTIADGERLVVLQLFAGRILHSSRTLKQYKKWLIQLPEVLHKLKNMSQKPSLIRIRSKFNSFSRTSSIGSYKPHPRAFIISKSYNLYIKKRRG